MPGVLSNGGPSKNARGPKLPSGLTLRQAIIKTLGNVKRTGLAVGEIAERVLNLGYETKSENLNPNVSSMLHKMKDEVEQMGPGVYVLKGRAPKA